MPNQPYPPTQPHPTNPTTPNQSKHTQPTTNHTQPHPTIPNQQYHHVLSSKSLSTWRRGCGAARSARWSSARSRRPTPSASPGAGSRARRPARRHSLLGEVVVVHLAHLRGSRVVVDVADQGGVGRHDGHWRRLQAPGRGPRVVEQILRAAEVGPADHSVQGVDARHEGILQGVEVELAPARPCPLGLDPSVGHRSHHGRPVADLVAKIVEAPELPLPPAKSH